MYMTMIIDNLFKKLQQLCVESTYDATRFFKTGPGSYSAHDKFAGIKNPVLRQLAKEYSDLSFDDIFLLLSSEYNEYRFLGLCVLTNRYKKSNNAVQDEIYSFYMKHIDCVSNWNLVDTSAHLIVGAQVYSGKVSVEVLEVLCASDVLWHRRIGIVATWYLIRKNKVDVTFHLAKQLLNDKHDLMHKAVGWMLREAGKRDEQKLRFFLNQYVSLMPRTMFRYAIEKLSDYKSMR